ncbi:MAG TPA: glycerophosphodiester phosphodiesterase family protein, partial [Chloroflexia bacterium]|nr:glycerophosphodiester phosphodiesterase family protein [Chloroflexia bacterium]
MPPTKKSTSRIARFAAGAGIGALAGFGVRRWLAATEHLPEAVAHRGGASTAPENTLAAYRNAQAAGILTWEMDVQLTTDGRLAVFHDDTLDRTTDGSGPLAGHSWDELAALDAGSWFGPQWRGERIPTLEDVIALARDAPDGGARLLIEIK